LRLKPSENSASAKETVETDSDDSDEKNSSVQVAMVEQEQVELASEDSAMADAEAIVISQDSAEELQSSNSENEKSEDSAENEVAQVAPSQPDATQTSALPNLPPIVEKVPPLPDMVANIDSSNLASDEIENKPDTDPNDEGLDTQIGSGEPTSIAEEAEQDAQDNLDLAADPSDYGVAKDHTIEVQAAETLGHYAEWLNLRASQLRRINRMRYGKPVVIGKRIKLDFSRVTPEQFEHQRKEYHRVLQEEFFTQFQIAGSEKHIIRRGDSLWILAKRKYKIPMWLLRQYNPDLSINNVKPGTEVTFPRIEARAEVDKEASKPKSAIVATIGRN
jgi:membrane-bound lytic murein transglycosylase D